jgi:hypothetical protein
LRGRIPLISPRQVKVNRCHYNPLKYFNPTQG